MKYPSKEQIILLHEELICTSGGLQGIRDEILLDLAVNVSNKLFLAKNCTLVLLKKQDD